MDVEIIGLEKLMMKLDRLGSGQVDAAIEKAIKSVALSFAAHARMLAPPGSGELRTSIHTKTERDGTGVTGYGYTNSDHAAFMEFGTGPVGAASAGNGSGVKVSYNLGPWLIKRGNFKKGVVVEQYADYWVYRGTDGKFHATRGNKPQPFMYPAFKATQRNALKLIARAFRRYIKQQGDGS